MTKVRSTMPISMSNSLYDAFLAKSDIDRLQKILARYEIFKIALNVPGHIVECGVFKGSGIYTWAKLQKIFKPNNDQFIIGFDFFEKSRKGTLKIPGDREIFRSHSRGWESKKTIFENLKALGISNVNLIDGDAVKTTKLFVGKNPGLRISILYLDLDVYEPTLACLKNLYPFVSAGGVVAFDEYAYLKLGESNAVDEYFNGKNLKLKSFSWAKTPTAYFVKS